MPALSLSVLARKGICAALLGAAVLSAAPTSARDGRNGALIGGAAAGVIGGLAVGALLNNGAAPPPPPPARRVYVEEEPVYVAPPPRRGPICHYERRKVWLDEVEFTYRRVEVCE
ncbi:hypothetical protein [Methylorubrum sp. SL192]|uniref:hypothetical protein n=1 Tax=Methylorubrum sp. SL192 TaxID=2995167 RepID=UPI002274EC18|nr:hypothetical protein [Methylorubrum sp. SL192]MCY1642967.1 hypothetical protein [Methylorubrum sp. SL192]